MLKKAIQYARASTDTQDQSAEDQLKATSEYARQHGLQIVADPLIDEGRSGVLVKHRYAFQKLIKMVENGKSAFDHVLVYDVSRWGRFPDDDEAAYWEYHCKRHGVQVIYTNESFSAENTMPNRITKSIKRSMASEYSRSLSAVVTRGLRSTAERGYWSGKAPYAYKRAEVDQDRRILRVLEEGEQKAVKNHHVILVPGEREEIKLVRQIFRWSDSGIGEITITNKLNTAKTPSPSGGTWGCTSVHCILTNPIYIGTLVWGRKKNGKFSILENSWGDKNPTKTKHDKEKWISVPSAFEPIVDKEVFLRVQDSLRKNAPNTNPGQGRSHGSQFLLTSLLECSQCGGRFSGRSYHRGLRRKPYLCYRCATSAKKGKAVCRPYVIQRERLDQFVLEKISERLKNPHFFSMVEKKVQEKLKDRGGYRSREVAIQSKLIKAKSAVSNLLEILEDRKNSNWDLYNDRLRERREEVESLEAELASLESQQLTRKSLQEALRKAKEKIRSLASGLLSDSVHKEYEKNELKKSIIKQFLCKGIVCPQKKEVRFYFYKIPPLNPQLQMLVPAIAEPVSASRTSRRTRVDRILQRDGRCR